MNPGDTRPVRNQPDWRQLGNVSSGCQSEGLVNLIADSSATYLQAANPKDW
jgi:hypothetical protein